MKIALIVPGGVHRSGEVRIIPALVALLKRLAVNHEVHVYPLSQEPQPAEWMLHDAHVHNVGAASTQIRILIAIAREHRRGRFDVVQAIFSGACGFLAVTAGGALRIPCAIHIAGGELVALPDIHYGGQLKWHGRVRENINLRFADAVTAASESILAQARALGCNPRRITLGVDLQSWPVSAPARRASEETARLVHVASLNRVKDQTTLLTALAILRTHRNFHLDIIGEDTLSGHVQQVTTQLGLNDVVTFHGFLRQRDAYPIVQRAHLHLISSRHEAGPLALLEAAIAGVPTVGTDVGHLHDWSPHAATVTPSADPPALAAAIDNVLGNEELRLTLAREAQRIAVVEDADYTAAEFEKLHGELAAGRTRV